MDPSHEAPNPGAVLHPRQTLPASGALLGHAPGRAYVAAGPLERVSEPPDDQPALYAPDFFLEDTRPWRTASAWKEVELGSVPTPSPLEAEWTEPDRSAWEETFRGTMAAIESGVLEKLVPVVFAEGRVARGGDEACDASEPLSTRLVGRAVAHARANPTDVTPYAHWDSTEGLAGVSPEILFRIRGDGVVETIALAGTVPPEAADRLMLDPKLRHEHELVVGFIKNALAPFGPVEQAPTTVLRLPRLAHLATPIEVRPTEPIAFQPLVSALHPTPALGGLPRDVAWERLRVLDGGTPLNPGPGGPWSARSSGLGPSRAGFGAPFGIRFPDGSGLCLVAIRNLTWRKDTLRIGAGGGLVHGSEMEAEWEELGRKMASVRAVFAA